MAPKHSPCWARSSGGIARAPCGAKACSANSMASAADPPATDCTGTCGLVAMTSASHAEGRQFDPGQVYSCTRALAHNDNAGMVRRMLFLLGPPQFNEGPARAELLRAKHCPKLPKQFAMPRQAPLVATNKNISPKVPRCVHAHVGAPSWWS